MTVQKTRLVLPRTQPRKVPPRVHQPHHEHVRFAPLSSDVDDHPEEVDLTKITSAIDKRNEDHFALSLPLANDVFDDGVSDIEVLGHEHRVEARSGEPLFTCRPFL